MSRSTLLNQNQNLGNHISSRPSTKLHAPPGGASSFSLAWGSDPVEPSTSITGSRRAAVGPSAPAHAAYVAPSVPAEDVYGGAGGGYTAPPVYTAAPAYAAPAPTYAAPVEPAYGAYAAPVPRAMAAPPHMAVSAPSTDDTGLPMLSSNAYACGSNQNTGNFITGRRTTRVAAPPGGRTSITLG